MGKELLEKREIWAQEKESFLLNSQSDLKEVLRCGLEMMQESPSQNRHEVEVDMELIYKNYFGVLLTARKSVAC